MATSIKSVKQRDLLYKLILTLSLIFLNSTAVAEKPVASKVISRAAADIYNNELISEPFTSASLESIKQLRFAHETILREKLKYSPDLKFNETDTEMCGVPATKVTVGENISDNRLLIFLHGGGYVFGSSRADVALSALMSKATGFPVLSLDYRLAPEHPFPAAMDDVVTCYTRLLKSGYSPSDIGIFGDSAGAGLTLASTLSMKQKNLPLPAVLGLMSPWADLSMSGDSRILVRDFDPLLSLELLSNFAQMYAGDESVLHPLISPVYADYSNMPPMVVHASTRDLLLSDSIRLARKVRADGGHVELDIWDGMWHVWQLSPHLIESQESIKKIAQFFQQNL